MWKEIILDENASNLESCTLPFLVFVVVAWFSHWVNPCNNMK